MFKFRDADVTKRIVEVLGGIERDLKFMHVCGTHQDTMVRFGIEGMLEEVGVKIVQGPGCPVCVTTEREFEEAKAIAEQGAIVASYGDMINVPSQGRSLQDMKSDGADVRIVYSVDDAVEIAQGTDREVVFMAAGFETTTPPTAAILLRGVPENMSILNCHRTVPMALKGLMEMGEVQLDGVVQPGHVSVIIGSQVYEFLSTDYGVPQVICGFEPLDVLMGVLMLSQQVREGVAKVENEYGRAVRPEGNLKAIEAMAEVFETRDIRWRGFPEIPGSGLKLKAEFEDHDASKRFENAFVDLPEHFPEPAGCSCGEVLRGIKDPRECPLFKVTCSPKNPVGPCMVSREGSCNILFRYSG